MSLNRRPIKSPMKPHQNATKFRASFRFRHCDRLFFLAAIGIVLSSSPERLEAAAPNVVTILQGQSNALFMQDGYNNYAYQSVFQPLVLALTGVPQVNEYANRYTSSNGVSVFSGTATYNSNPEDTSLWLDANGSTPATWPLGADGVSCSTYFGYVKSLYSSWTGVPLGFFRIHSEYDTKKTGADASYYSEANHRFVGLMRQATGLATTQVPVFYGSPCFWSGVTDQGLATVRSAWLAEINNSANNAHWAWGCVSDCNDMGDVSHMDATGDAQACARMGIRFARWLYDNGYSVNDLSSLPKLGPKVTRFDRVSGVSNQIDLTIQHDKGTDLIIPSGVALAGFEVFDGSNRYSGTAAQRLDSTHIRLTLSGNLSSSTTITLDYLRQNGFYGPGKLITDNWHTLSKPSYIQNALNNSTYTGLTMALRRFEDPLTIGVTDAVSLEDPPAGGASGRFEAETLTVAAQTPSVTYRLVSDARFSAGTGSFFDATAAGQFVTFDVPNIAARTYNIRIGVKTWNNKGIFQLAISRLDQQGSPTNVGSPVDEYSAGEVFTEVNLGNWAPGTTSDKAFRFTVTGKNASSTGYGLAIDYITLTPQ